PITATVTADFGQGPPGATLGGTLRVAAVDGLAAFDDLSIDLAGAGYALAFSCQGFLGAQSASFDVAPAAASRLAIRVEPTSIQAGVAFNPALEVVVRDRFGNQTTDAVTVAAGLGQNPAGGVLLGTGQVAAAGGLAAFSNLALD